MSTPDGERTHTFSNGQIEVAKTVEQIDETVGKVSFFVEYLADSAGTVRITDWLPAGWPADRVGFHPEYDQGLWRIEDGAVVFERDFTPAETYRTLYALKLDTADELVGFEMAPEVLIMQASSAGNHSGVTATPRAAGVTMLAEPEAPGDGNQISDTNRDAALEGERIPETESTREPTTAHFAENGNASTTAPSPELRSEQHADRPTSVADDDREHTNGECSASGSGSLDIPDAAAVPDADEASTLISRFLREIERANDDQRTALTEALSIQQAGSLGSRIDRLEQELSQLSAYREALREFIDTEGGATEIFESVREEQTRLHAEIRELAGQNDISALGDSMETVVDRLDRIERDLEKTTSTLPAEIERIESHIEDLDAIRAETVAEMGAHRGQLDAFGERLDAIEETTESELASIRQSIDTLQMDIAETSAWRSQFQDSLSELVRPST